MPSNVTAVPGSQGPRHSGSVMVEALQVPTQASARLGPTTPDVTWPPRGDPVGLEDEADVADEDESGWTPLTARDPLGGVTASRVTPLRPTIDWAASAEEGGSGT